MYAKHWQCTIDVYHSDSAHSLSHSEAECFRRSPELYHGTYLTEEIGRQQSAALAFGQALHSWVLEDIPPLCIPKDVLTANGQRRGKAWEEFSLSNPGKSFFSDEEIRDLNGMVQSIQRHEAASCLLSAEDSEREFTIKWMDDDTKLNLRCRIDSHSPRISSLIDLKSCKDASPKAFAATAVNFGYHRQAAWYLDGAMDYFKESFDFVFIAVEKEPPYRVETYELDEEFIALGRRQNRDILADFNRCIETGRWRGKWAGKIVQLSMPRWAEMESEWAL